MRSFATNAKAFQGSYAEIEKIAELVRCECLKDSGSESNPPTGPAVSSFLVRLVELFGGKLVTSTKVNAEEWSGGSLLIRPGDDPKFEISLSPFTSPLRDNFTIGHELGHYFLHYAFFYPESELPKEPLVFYRYGSGVQESQANRFAAALLMPRGEFEAALQRNDNDLRAVAAHFNVSHAAAEARNSYR
jgi:hypothetical protein